MQIDATNSATHQPTGSEPPGKMKQLFQRLGSALESGNLSDAKKALSQLRANAPASANNDGNPIAQKIVALGRALDSGDIEAAQAVYNSVPQMMSQPSGGVAQARGSGSPPPAIAPASGANKLTSGEDTSSGTSRVYDPKDSNKDGTVSWNEEQSYNMKHPEAGAKDSLSVTFDSTA